MPDTELQQLAKTDRNPVQESRYQELLKSGGGIGSSGGSFEDTIRRTMALQREANQPAVQSLEASIPETSAKFSQARTQLEAKQKPLEDRYKNLLDTIKGNQTTAENRQTVTTRNELGRRGLVGGGLYDQTVTDALNPITQQFTGLYKDTSLAREDALRSLTDSITNLTGEETEATRAIRNAIAQLQSGAASTGISQGIGQYQFNENQTLQRQQMEEQARQQAIQTALAQAQQSLAERQFNEATLPQVNYAINKPYYKESGTGSNLPDLNSIFGG